MSSPLTFTTEAERLKAREQYVRICHAADIANESMRIGDWYYESLFDRAFPPIKPPKMVPLLAWARLDEDNDCYGVSLHQPSETGRPIGHRIARVRVVEVDE